MWVIILFILLIYSFVKGTFEFEPVTRRSLIIIPAYAFVMMVLALHEEHFAHKVLLTILLLIIGILIGFFQATRVSVTGPQGKDRYGRPIIKVKRNWPYLFGWIVVFVIDIIIEFADQAAVFEELFKEILKDLSSIAFFSFSNEWFVWALTMATSFVYGISLLARYPAIRRAVAPRHRK